MMNPLETSENPNWPRIAQQDLTYFHDDVINNHPGPVNSLDPDFLEREAKAYALGLSRVEKVTDFAGYLWLMRGYAASFNDGHMGVRPLDSSHHLPSLWPGFLTAFTPEGDQVVVVSEAGSPIPVGARLVTCNGIEANAFAETNVGGFVPSWELFTPRHEFGYTLFIDEGNPFIQRPTECQFLVNGELKNVCPQWTPLTEAHKKRVIEQVVNRLTPELELRRTNDDGWWLSLSSFSADEAEAARISGVIAELKRHKEAILASPYLVIDLRGNSGGSGEWAYQVAVILWGKDAVNALPTNTGTDWRASRENLAYIKEAQSELEERAGISDELKAYMATIANGLADAVSAGKHYFEERSTEGAEAHEKANIEHSPLTLPVYLVTDEFCFSAALDAVDYFRGLGAIHVGRETDGDTLYMEIKLSETPSGLARINVPLKVLRNRPRASLATWKPHFYYAGDLNDSAALEHWVATLPRAIGAQDNLTRAE